MGIYIKPIDNDKSIGVSVYVPDNIFLELHVNTNGNYIGDWRSAIDEASVLAKRFGVVCRLNYINQYYFCIDPNMTDTELFELKKRNIVVGM